MTWFAVDTLIREDERLAQVAYEHGPAAYAVWLMVLVQAKERGRTDEQGRRVVPLLYDRLAMDAGLQWIYNVSYVDKDQCEMADDVARRIVHSLVATELLEKVEELQLGVIVVVPRWKKHQEDALKKNRDARHKAKKREGRKKAVAQPSPTVAPPSPHRRLTETVTSTDTKEVNAKEGQPAAGQHAATIERFKLIASRRDGTALKVDVPAVLRCLDDFAHLPGLDQRAVDCAEWLGSARGARRTDAARVLRAWLKRDAESLPKPREGTNRFVLN